MAQSAYLRRVQAINRNQGPNDVERGLQVGQTIGKLLGGLGDAIKGAQKDALANKLMDQQSISQDQPGGTQDLGTLGGGSQSGGPQPGGPGNQNIPDPDPDPVQTNQPGASVNPDFQPEYSFTDMPDTSGLSSAVNQQKTANALAPPTNLQVAPGGASPSDFSLNPSDYSSGKGATVGSTIHTGGVQELELRKEMLAQQLQQAQLAKATAPPPAPDPTTVALRQVQLAQARKNLLKPDAVSKPAVDKTSLANNMDTEPVEDQAQLVRTYESTHGKGSFDDAVSAFNAPDTVPDPTDSTGKKTIPNTPKVVGNSVILNPNSEKNSVTLQLGEAQTLAKQLNTRRIAQGLPPVPVPGIDPTLGSSRANPIDVKTRLDGASVPKGRWIRTPTGQIIQRP